jgi:hypothetical protein
VAKAILMDEFHLTIYATHGLSPREYDTIHAAVEEPHLQADLRSAVKAVIRKRPALDKVRATVTR